MTDQNHPYGSPGPQGGPQHGQPWGQPPAHGQQYGAPAPGQGPQSFIEVVIQGSMWTSNALTPRVHINGQVVPSSYKSNTYPVPPGQHHIHVDAQWMRTYGQADLPVNVGPGESVRVYYRAPLHQFATGNIGFEPQQAKGKAFFFGILGFCALLVLFIVLLAVFA